MSEVAEANEDFIEVETEFNEPEAETNTGEQEPEADDESEDIVVTIGEEPPPADENTAAPEWVRELRKNHRDLQKKNRELEEKLKSTVEPVKTVDLGRKPTLEDSDYDADDFEQKLSGWYERKRLIDEQAAKAEADQREQQKAWQARLDNYGKAKTELKVKDFEDAEDVSKEKLSVTQQGIILQGAENPALVIYALGKNPKKAAELGSITDPVKFSFAVAKLETQLKVSNRKSPPPPEGTVRGTGAVSGAVGNQLERLRAEAEKTGDLSKVMAFKRQQREAQK